MGVVLFNMVTAGEYPFENALDNDPMYKYFAKGRAD